MAIASLKTWLRDSKTGCATKGFKTHRRFSRAVGATRHGMEASEPELQDCRAHRRAEVHWLRSLPHCMLGWRAPVHPSRPRCRARWTVTSSCTRRRRTNEARSRASIAATPVTRKERAAASAQQGPYPTPLARIPRVDETECVGCNLCSLVCPVDGCITMVRVDTGVAAGDLGRADERRRVCCAAADAS